MPVEQLTVVGIGRLLLISRTLAIELHSLSAYHSSVSHGVKILVCGLAVKKSHLGFKSLLKHAGKDPK